MNGWAEDAMQEAIDFLSKARRNDLASDLNRIFKSMRFDDTDVMRCADAEPLADRILEAESVADLTDCLRDIVRIMNVGHCTLHVATEVVPETYSTKVITTYPPEWVRLYVNRRFYLKDPVLRASKSRSTSFYWDTACWSDPVEATFWNEAKAHGIGTAGYTVPISTETGNVLALSVSAMLEAQAFREMISPYESDLYNLGVILVDAFGQLASDERPMTFNPTEDQLMVLRGIAMGAGEEQLASRPYLYGSYATVSRSICTLFKTKTVAQAAIVATRLGLLEDLPLLAGDIMAAADAPTARAKGRAAPEAEN